MPSDRKAAEAAGVSQGQSLVGGLQGIPSTGSTLLNSTDPFYKELRDLPFHIAIARCCAPTYMPALQVPVYAGNNMMT